MPVRTYDMPPTHVVQAATLAKAQPLIYRMLAILLWLFSLCGNVLTFGGGWDVLLAAWGTNAFWSLLGDAVLYSAGLQALCTTVQFVFCNRPKHLLYLLALLASFVPSFLGYKPVLIDPFAAGLALPWLALLYGGVTMALILADILPERIFVKH